MLLAANLVAKVGSLSGAKRFANGLVVENTAVVGELTSRGRE